MNAATPILAGPVSLFLALLGAAAAVSAEAIEPVAAGGPNEERGVVATVNDDPIYLEDLERRLQEMHNEVGSTSRRAPDLERLVARLVNDALLAQEAEALGLHLEEPIPTEVEQLRRRLAVRELRREEIGDRIEIPDETVREAFEREYRQVTLRVVTTADQGDALRILEQLRGGADFASIAAERSIDPYKSRGGLVEALPRIDLMTEIAEEAFAAEPGELLGPIRTPIGWAVVRVESFAPADPERLETVRDELRQRVYFLRSRELEEALAERLEESHRVEVVEDAAAAVAPRRAEDGRLLPAEPDPEAVVARVDDQVISAAEYAEALRWRWKGVSNEAAARAAAPLVLGELIRGQLLLAEALERGYHQAPAVLRSARALERQLMVERYLREVLAATVEVDPQEIRSYYEENRQRFGQPPRFHVRQITVATEAEAERLIGLLDDGSDFAWLARRHSTDSLAPSGGERGWVTPMPGADRLSDRLLRAEVGDVLGPIEARDGWLVLQVTGREEQDLYPFERVSGNVRSELFQRKLQQKIDQVLTKLRERSRIEIHDEVLESLAISVADGDEAGGRGE